jgi:hypothetical protein
MRLSNKFNVLSNSLCLLAVLVMTFGLSACGGSDDSENCEENFTWNGSECMPNSQTAQQCSGLPANAEWNTASSITQTWDGDSWQPSTEGVYGLEATTSECKFKCSENYEWNETECVEAASCEPGVDVTVSAESSLPQNMGGHYNEAFDCQREEGGAWNGSDDAYMHCFRKDDASSWRIWNTGCGWEIGRMEVVSQDPFEQEWARYARTYTESCSEIPAEQLGTQALTTTTFYDGFGNPIVGVESALCEE